MKKTSKSVMYDTIKSTIKKLGISVEDTKGIINYIKFMERKEVTEPTTKSQVITKNTKKESTKKESTIEAILSILSSNPEKAYSIQELSELIGVRYAMVQISLKELRASRKIKVVDFEKGQSGPSKLLYQTWKSPLKALKIVTEKQGYSTINSFIKNSKTTLNKDTFPSVVKEAGLTIYPLLLSIGIAQGYKNSDLKKVAAGIYSKSVTKVEEKTKRKYDRKPKVQPVEPTVTEVKNGLTILEKLFKKKGNASELIKF